MNGYKLPENYIIKYNNNLSKNIDRLNIGDLVICSDMKFDRYNHLRSKPKLTFGRLYEVLNIKKINNFKYQIKIRNDHNYIVYCNFRYFNIIEKEYMRKYKIDKLLSRYGV